MPFKNNRPLIILKNEEKKELSIISKSRTESKSKVERATIILYYSEGINISQIAKRLNTNRPKVQRTIDRALGYGVMVSLKDLPGRGSRPRIDQDARAWILSVACRKPKELGLASELWTTNELAKYLRIHCKEYNHLCLEKISKGTVFKILEKSDIKPHKIAYYMVRKDPQFEEKMAQVLCVYKEIEIYRNQKESKTAVISYDEKPGIQAIGNMEADLNPVPEKFTGWKRDNHYKRHGTLSLLASIDLLTGKVYGQVQERHRSKEFVEFLKKIDRIYPEDVKIKIILDNHSAHISKETNKYLSTIPNRFDFVFTPTHASWLNLIEMFFSKMARSFLRGIRVDSKQELKERIYQYLKEVNEMPTIFQWKWKMDEVKIL